MSNSGLIKNSTYSVIQTITVSLSTLLIYKLLIYNFGLNQTGLWSYLASILTITSMGSIGFANSLIYYVPKYLIENDFSGLKTLINTSLIFTTIFTVVLCIITYFIFYIIIPFTIDKEFVYSANQLLFYIVISFFLSGISNTFLAVIDASGLMYKRSKIIIICTAIYLLLCILMIQKWGIIAIPLADIIKNALIIILSFNVVKQNIPSYSLQVSIDKKALTSIFKYGYKFQIISITQIISDPFFKSLVTKFSGTGTTAIFDICLKLLAASRQILIAINQSITPAVATLNTKKQLENISSLFISNFKMTYLVGIFLLLSPFMFSDVLSILMLGSSNSIFNFTLICLGVALFVNTISTPAHFVCLGTGKLKWTMLNNIISSGLMFLITPLIGVLIGGNFIILGWAIPTIVGSGIFFKKIFE
jgi:O-antigen/teichoic acid export membrane protein